MSLCSEEGPCSTLWFAWLKRAELQPRWQHNTLFPCICWHSLQSSSSDTREGLNVLLLVTSCSLALLPPTQGPKPVKDHFLGFVFNLNSQASLCVQCEIIPTTESENTSFFLYINLTYPFCSLFPPLPLETCFRCGYCGGALFLATYPTQDEDGLSPTCSFIWLLCFGKMVQQRYQLPKINLKSKIFVSKGIWRSLSRASYFHNICALR